MSAKWTSSGTSRECAFWRDLSINLALLEPERWHTALTGRGGQIVPRSGLAGRVLTSLWVP